MDSNREQTRRVTPRSPRETGGVQPPASGGPRRGSPIDEARETLQESASNVGDTIGGIIEDLQGIVRGEVQLAKTELKEEATQMGKGAGMIGAGALVGLVGFIFLMLAVTYLLNQWLEMWIAAGTVALVLLIIAAILAVNGKNQISEANLVPEETVDSLKEDKEWASRQMNSVGK